MNEIVKKIITNFERKTKRKHETKIRKRSSLESCSDQCNGPTPLFLISTSLWLGVKAKQFDHVSQRNRFLFEKQNKSYFLDLHKYAEPALEIARPQSHEGGEVSFYSTFK